MGAAPRNFTIAAWIGVSLDWMAASFSWMVASPVVLSVIATIFACLASVAAFQASRRTARLREHEDQLAIQKICEECKNGTPPAVCPLAKLPEHCKRRHCYDAGL